MEISPLLIYIWSLADKLIWASGVQAVIVSSILCLTYPHKLDWKSFPKPLKVICVASTIIAVLGQFIPSSKTIAMMYVVPKIAESELIQKDLPEVYKMAVESLKEKLK